MSLILHCLQAMRRFRSFSHLFHCDLEQFILARDVKKKDVCLPFSYHELGKRASIYCNLLYLPGRPLTYPVWRDRRGRANLSLGPHFAVTCSSMGPTDRTGTNHLCVVSCFPIILPPMPQPRARVVISGRGHCIRKPFRNISLSVCRDPAVLPAALIAGS